MDREIQKYYNAIKENPDMSYLPLYRCLDDPEKDLEVSAGSALEAVKRLDRFLTAAKLGDLKLITSIFPPNGSSAKEIIDEELGAAVKSGQIVDYKMYINDGREKMGLPPHNNDCTSEIYLYDNVKLFKFDESSIKPQLRAIEQSIP